jgi:glycosyltransferase involved in cell wall biosynthesis
MKIDLIGPSYPFRGGISHYTTLLFQILRTKHKVQFYSFKRQYPRFLYPGKTDRDESKSPLKDAEAQPLLDSINPLSWLSVTTKIVRDKPEITIFPWWVVFWTPPFLTIIFLLKLFSKTKILFICHNFLEHEKNRMKFLISKLVLSRGDYFIVHSEEEKKRLIEATGKTEVKVNFHPTYDVFNPRELQKDEARKKLGFSGDNIILFFGFVRDYKGLKYLLKAMPIISEKTDASLVIAGEFWEDKGGYLKLIEKLHIEDKVTIIDKYILNEDLPYIFYACDIVVLPYTSVTGSGLVQLALGFNKPVVVSRIGALAEIVRDKQTGFLVSPKNSQEIADAVISFFRDSDKGKMTASIKAEREKYSWEHLVRSIEDFDQSEAGSPESKRH